jgi:hypothetical protein
VLGRVNDLSKSDLSLLAIFVGEREDSTKKSFYESFTDMTKMCLQIALNRIVM